jgi:hypothetical protein
MKTAMLMGVRDPHYSWCAPTLENEMEHQHAKPRADDWFTAYPQFLYREVES